MKIKDRENLVNLCNDLLINYNNKSSRTKILNQIKDELNNIFKKENINCLDIIYTDNDGVFFGMYTIPIIRGNLKIEKYCIEIDSRLLSPLLMITDRELCAIFLHEIGHCVAEKIEYKKIDDIKNVYIAKNNIKINSNFMISTQMLKNIVYTRCVRNNCSIFNKKDEEFFADNIARREGFGEDLEIVFYKIKNYSKQILSEKRNISALLWYLKLNSNLNRRLGYAKEQLKEYEKIESSKIMRDLYKKSIDELDRLSKRKSSINEETYLINKKISCLSEGVKSMTKAIQHGMVRDIEDKMYELEIRSKHLDNEYEAINLIKELNVYIDSLDIIIEKTKDKKKNEQLNKYLKKYLFLRDNIARMPSFKKKVYGIYIEYPEENDNIGY